MLILIILETHYRRIYQNKKDLRNLNMSFDAESFSYLLQVLNMHINNFEIISKIRLPSMSMAEVNNP